MKNQQQIIFFDGVCNLCNSFVDFLLSRDVEQHFTFAPLQGETAKTILPPQLPKELKSVVLWSQGEIFKGADAALMILQQLGGPWGAVRIFWIVPPFLRNFVYGLVASGRYRLFGRRQTCRLPTPEERARFLD